MTEIHIALTGHRPNKLAGYDITTPPYKRLQQDLEQYIRYQLRFHDTVWGHSGLALGADTIWSKAILAMREQFPGRVMFYAEIPMYSQADRWFKTADIDFWKEQIQTADSSTLYSYQDTYTDQEAAEAMNDRNIGMIDQCDILLALWDGSSGGTGRSVRYAKSIDKPIQKIDPRGYFK